MKPRNAPARANARRLGARDRLVEDLAKLTRIAPRDEEHREQIRKAAAHMKQQIDTLVERITSPSDARGVRSKKRRAARA